MIRLIVFSLFGLLFFASAKHSVAIPEMENADTCFYTIHVPADIDFPETPHFDTTIVRSLNCNKQFLRLPSWGTQTDYTISRDDSLIKIHRSTLFSMKQGQGLIDITDLPNGTYAMYLMACGNGGGFTIYLK